MPAHKPNRKRTLCLLACFLAALFFLGALYHYIGPEDPVAPFGQIAVHFIDVGQGDATLIEAQGRFMLIDGGERGNEQTIINYLQNLGVRRIDYVIASHPHSDHIGGLAHGVIDAFPIGTIIAPRFSPENVPTTRVYERFLEAVARAVEQGTQARYSAVGETIALGNAQVTILGPLREYPGINNNSIILRLDYGETSALFTGDAERTAERELADTYGHRLRVCVLHAGHHGSNTSSNAEFLYYVAPRYVVIPVGVYNSFGHPDPRAMERIRATNAIIYRTDIDGTVVMRSDGLTFWRNS